jgi:3-oxoacid CoA-transferase subunit B
VNCVDMIITELGVFSRPSRKDLFRLIEVAPGVTRAEIRGKTPAKYLE